MNRLKAQKGSWGTQKGLLKEVFNLKGGKDLGR